MEHTQEHIEDTQKYKEHKKQTQEQKKPIQEHTKNKQYHYVRCKDFLRQPTRLREGLSPECCCEPLGPTTAILPLGVAQPSCRLST